MSEADEGVRSTCHEPGSRFRESAGWLVHHARRLWSWGCERSRRLKRTLSKMVSARAIRDTLDVMRRRAIAAYWWRGVGDRNWGDRINVLIIQSLSGKRVVHADDIFAIRPIKVYACVGSIVENLARYRRVQVWGSGIIREESRVRLDKRTVIHAVRGPRTRERLMKLGHDVPQVYGDPARLMPMIYNPPVARRLQLGIVPHFVDIDSAVVQRLAASGVAVIDIFSGEEDFIDRLLECRHVVSSSLHGLIVADAYRIPSKWIRISDRIFGGEFKFLDYYESMGHFGETALTLHEDVSAGQLIDACSLKADRLDLNALVDACPFVDRERFEALRGRSIPSVAIVGKP